MSQHPKTVFGGHADASTLVHQHTGHVGWQPLCLTVVLGMATIALCVLGAALLTAPGVQAEHAERSALMLLLVAGVQGAYMAARPTLPWVVVVVWALLQWHVLLMVFERATGAPAWVLGLALTLQAGIALRLWADAGGRMLCLRRLTAKD